MTGLFPTDFYTIGYEGLTAQKLADILKDNGVKTLADIRSYAKSMNPSFNKTELEATMARNGIKYVHMKELGNPKEFWGKSNWKTLYRNHILAKVPESIRTIKALPQPVALMCREKDPADCHRNVVAQELANSGFMGSHIRRT